MAAFGNPKSTAGRVTAQCGTRGTDRSRAAYFPHPAAISSQVALFSVPVNLSGAQCAFIGSSVAH